MTRKRSEEVNLGLRGRGAKIGHLVTGGKGEESQETACALEGFENHAELGARAQKEFKVARLTC